VHEGQVPHGAMSFAGTVSHNSVFANSLATVLLPEPGDPTNSMLPLKRPWLSEAANQSRSC